jgi:hypothetical protein
MKRMSLFAVAALLFAGAQLHAQGGTKQDSTKKAAATAKSAAKQAGSAAAAAKSDAKAADKSADQAAASAKTAKKAAKADSAAGRATKQEEGHLEEEREEGFDRQKAVRLWAASRFPQRMQ